MMDEKMVRIERARGVPFAWGGGTAPRHAAALLGGWAGIVDPPDAAAQKHLGEKLEGESAARAAQEAQFCSRLKEVTKRWVAGARLCCSNSPLLLPSCGLCLMWKGAATTARGRRRLVRRVACGRALRGGAHARERRLKEEHAQHAAAQAELAQHKIMVSAALAGTCVCSCIHVLLAAGSIKERALRTRVRHTVGAAARHLRRCPPPSLPSALASPPSMLSLPPRLVPPCAPLQVASLGAQVADAGELKQEVARLEASASGATATVAELRGRLAVAETKLENESEAKVRAGCMIVGGAR